MEYGYKVVTDPNAELIWIWILLQTLGISLGLPCWGEGEDTTLRSMPSSPRVTNDAKEVGPMRTSRLDSAAALHSSPLQDEREDSDKVC
jgi:hypothetical protein